MAQTDLKYVPLGIVQSETGLMLKLTLSYQHFGQSIQTAPVVVVTHGLTGNSSVTGPGGWWSSLIGPGKVIDTNRFAVLAFDLPGNGYGNQPGALIQNYEQVNARDVARWLGHGLDQLKVEQVHTALGVSLGGGILWELALLKPDLIQTLVPVAADWKSTDWVIAHNHVQKALLQSNDQPLETARMMAMLFYRSPESFRRKFDRGIADSSGQFAVEQWLNFHGERLKARFAKQAYLSMNQLLSTIDVSRGRGTFAQSISVLRSKVTQIAVDTDLFFVAQENKRTHHELQLLGKRSSYGEIASVHGHDAFLIESGQLQSILKDIFAFEHHYNASA